MTSSIEDTQVAALLGAEEIDPALLIEMLLPVLWLSRVEAFEGNSSVEGSMVLHHAYEQLGIASHVYTVLTRRWSSSRRHPILCVLGQRHRPSVDRLANRVRPQHPERS